MPETIRKLLGELEYSEIFIEKGNPSPEIGLNHDIYVNSQTFEVFKKTNDVWVAKGFTGDVNINPDWNETNTSKKSYILNKPDVATKDLLKELEKTLNGNITDLETLLNHFGVIGLDYKDQERKVSLIRPDNTIEDGVVLPVCDGLKPGFIDANTFLQVSQNKKDIRDEIASRVTTDVKSSSFDPLTNALILKRSDESTLKQVLPKILEGNRVKITKDSENNIIIGVPGVSLSYNNQTGVLSLTENGVVLATVNLGLEKYVSQASVVKNPQGKPEGTYIKLQFEGGAPEIFIPTSEIGKLYSAGTGISINTDGVISCIDLENKVDKAGDTMTGKLVLPASIADSAYLNLPHAANPTTPVNGDIWSTTASLLARINGATRTLYHNGNAGTAALATVTQAEAQAGTATTVRAWTPERVKQAIDALAVFNYDDLQNLPTIPTFPLSVPNGGTGRNTVVANQMLYASAANTYATVATSAFGRGLLNTASGTMITGLNADTVDGKHFTDIESSIPKSTAVNPVMDGAVSVGTDNGE